MAESQASTGLDERLFDDPSQLSQLLRQRAGSNSGFHPPTSTESAQPRVIASPSTAVGPLQPPAAVSEQQQQRPIVLAPSNRASPRRVATARHVRLALPTHHSAPTSTGFVKHMDGAATMQHSFHVLDAPGDTQPDSQFYNNHVPTTSGIHMTQETPHPRKGSVPKSLFVEHEGEDEDEADSPTSGIDFVASSQDHQSPSITSPTVIQDDDIPGALPIGHYAPTSPLKFETPAVPARTRDSSGPALSSAVRTDIATPGTVAAVAAFAFPGFGAGGVASMSLTQVWENTQAPTSPAMPAASEDLAFTRPSPNFTHVRPSSPAEALSSPIKAMRAEASRSDPPIRSSSEPRAEYVSMKESQERRRRIASDQPIQLVEQDSWETPSVAQLRVQKRKMKEELERRAAVSFAHVSAPTPISLQPRKVRPTGAPVSSPTRATSRASSTGQDDCERTAAERGQAQPVNGHDEDDSPDELSEHVALTAQTSANHSSRDTKVQVPKTSSHPTRTQSGRSPRHSSQLATPTSQLQRESQPQAPASQPLARDTFRPHSSRDSVAIMDSQPDATAHDESIPRPKSLRFPSSPSINQYSINQTTMASKTGYTSQVISSSIAPLPPGFSPGSTVDETEDIVPEDEERVPSSPPISALDGSVTYDEHERAYDEYAEDGGTCELGERESSHEGSSTDDEELLPDQPEREDCELDLVQSPKVDLGTDQEVQETLEQGPYRHALPDERIKECLQPSYDNEGEAHKASRPPRVQRQDTIPETDALDETQPSFFPEHGSATRDIAAPVIDSGAPHQNSADLFHAAHEELSEPQPNQRLPVSSKEDRTDILTMGERLRSVKDIHDMPDTQQSAAEGEFEIPRLSGFDEDDLLQESSPAPPSAKRRKVTYAGKRNAFGSPLKTNTASKKRPDQPPASPLDQVRRAPIDTPPTSSAQEREAKGASAAAQAREDAQTPYIRQATLKTKPAVRSSRVQNQKKGALKSVDKEMIRAMSSPTNSPPKAKTATKSRTTRPATPTKRPERKVVAEVDVDMSDAHEERDEVVKPSLGSESGEVPQGRIILPNRVLASWPGSHFYPAVCLGRASASQLQVRFDDGNTATLDMTLVRSFDLRPGDHIKVDQSGRKKHTYVIVGFKDKIAEVNAEGSLTTDQRGYTTVVLEEKRRDSLPASKATQPAEHISVSMSSVYLTTQLWTRLRDRSYHFSAPNSPSKSTSRIGTPIQTVDCSTTLSFSRRGMTAPSLLKHVTGRAGSVGSSSTRSSSGVFSNMAFVLTSTAMDVDKEELSRIIKTNGGLVLEQGFHELFDYESADVPSTPQSRHQSRHSADGSQGLTLKNAYKDLAFVALVSDSHSRSTKYIQALALNVPCLHLRWVHDSLNASRAVPFIKYLLAAGVSKFLDPNGVVRSRTLAPYDPGAEDISFEHTVSNRDLLLRDQTVLLVTGRSKKEMEKRQPFIFLTHALGSTTVGRCADLAAASQMIQEGQWDWIYVDNGEAGVADAAAELFGTGKPAASGKTKKGKKRKRDEGEGNEELVARGTMGRKKVKITCAEFVIQSLILGALVEE
ncbi:radiation sensitive protein rad9 [Pleosporales sp. CAS-2024a]